MAAVERTSGNPAEELQPVGAEGGFDPARCVEPQRRVEEGDGGGVIAAGERQLEPVADQVADHDVEQPAIVEGKFARGEERPAKQKSSEQDKDEYDREFQILFQ